MRSVEGKETYKLELFIALSERTARVSKET